jgi:hypothetical protein
MTALDAAKGIYREEAKRLEGQRADALAEALKRQAQTIRTMQGETTAEVHETLVVPQAEREMTGETREEMRKVMQEGNATQVAKHLEQAGKDVEETMGKTNAKNESLGEGIAGQAQLNAAGTQTFDAQALEGEGTVVDGEWAKGVAEHEQFHTEQKEPDADQVILANGDVLTAHDFIEAGAIAAQEKAASGSVNRLSDDYKQIRTRFAALLPSDQLLELSREGKLREAATVANMRMAA